MDIDTFLKLKTMTARRFAAETGMDQTFVHMIRRKIKPLPLKYAASVERVTGGLVTRKELFPDNWHLIWPELLNSNDCDGQCACNDKKRTG